MYYIRYIVLLFLTLIAFPSSSLDTKNVNVAVAAVSLEEREYSCKVKITLKDGWKVYGNVSFSLNGEKVQSDVGYTPSSNVYKTTIKIPYKQNANDVTLCAEFSACSENMCSLVEKEFSINLADALNKQKPTMWYILLMAFLGGLVLNFMPCVLPVLSLKLHSIINKKSTKLSAFYTWCWVMFSFLVFSIAMASLKHFGYALGWGMQFQNVHFLNITALIVFLFVLSCYDRLKIFISSDTDFANNKSEHVKSFVSGVVATILAIPCTAPFLGTATIVAFDSGATKLITILMTIGLGFSVPYLLMSVFNVKISIKPGRWMSIVKHVLGVGIIMTFVWLIWLLSGHVNAYQMTALGVLYVVLWMCAEKSVKISLIVCMAICSVPSFSKINLLNEPSKTLENRKMWMSFDSVKLQELIKQGHVVFVNVTADWCMTCKYNKSILLDTDEFFNLIKRYNCYCMEGDLTYNNEMVALFLKVHNQSGIPFNIVFGPNATAGIKLSVIPSIKEIEDAIKAANTK